MGAFISDQMLDRVRSANEIVEVIGTYFPLKRAGTNFRALCPFHKEKTPSFNVHPQKQVWRCFGCGAGGDVFTFVMRYENLDFVGAVQRLADRAGIPLESDSSRNGPTRSQKDALFKLHDEAATLFHQNLLHDPTAQIARDYLAKRKISTDTATKWRLGYALDRWDALLQWARERNLPETLLESAGLIVRGNKGVYDRFRGRLMISICDEQGRVCAFSARILTDAKDQPKYVNSPETPIFQKGKMLFALDKARRPILDENQVILCEGQLDAITCHEAGVDNVVAPQGTAFTEHHARILKRHADEAVLMFDSDHAGQNAAMKNAEPLWENGFAIRVVVLPTGHDPDSFVKAEGAEKLRGLIRSAPRFFDFLLDHLSRQHDPKTERGKLQIANLMAQWLCKVRDPLLQGAHTQETARRLDVREDIIRQVMKQVAGKKRPTDLADTGQDRGGTQVTDANPAIPSGSAAEEILLQTMFADERVMDWIDQHLDRAWLTSSIASRIIRQTLDLHIANQWAGPASLFNQSANDQTSRLLADISTRPPIQGSLQRAAADCLSTLHRDWINLRLKSLRHALSNPSMPVPEALKLQKEVFDLRRALDQIGLFSTRSLN
jgi:DNA primase